METRFDRAFQALTTAYFEGTLRKWDCEACAVGNICKQAAADLKITSGCWSNVFSAADRFTPETFAHRPKTFGVLAGERLIAKTGFTWHELYQIEEAFEYNTKIKWTNYVGYSEQEILEDQYNGLAAVIEVLCQLDGITTVAEHKAEFRKHPKLVAA